jgi:hypothetical protein
MSLLRFFVTVVVAVPLLLAASWPYTWLTSFVIAVIAISGGFGAEALVKRGQQPTDSRAAEATSTDREWERTMLLKKALAAEERGECNQTIALFEQVLRNPDRQEDAELARRHLQAVTNKRSPADGV